MARYPTIYQYSTLYRTFSIENLKLFLQRLHVAPSKHCQKLIFLKRYLLRKTLRFMINIRVTKSLLKRANRILRVSVRWMVRHNRKCSDVCINRVLGEIPTAPGLELSALVGMPLQSSGWAGLTSARGVHLPLLPIGSTSLSPFRERETVKSIELRRNLLPTVGIPSNPSQQWTCRM